MKWITRENAKVDRVACPWLIRRFVDPEAEFLFVPADRVRQLAEELHATPYDIPGVKLGHDKGQCSFESILANYGLLGNEALVELGKIVHAADVAEDADRAPEGRGLQAIALGFSMIHGAADHRKLELESPMYDALYAWCEHRVAQAKTVA